MRADRHDYTGAAVGRRVIDGLGGAADHVCSTGYRVSRPEHVVIAEAAN